MRFLFALLAALLFAAPVGAQSLGSLGVSNSQRVTFSFGSSQQDVGFAGSTTHTMTTPPNAGLAAQADRYVYAYIYTSGAASPVLVSATLGGVSATILINQLIGSTTSNYALVGALVPTGATIAVAAVTTINMTTMCVGTYSVIGARQPLTAIGSASNSGASPYSSPAMNAIGDGFQIWTARSQAITPTYSLTMDDGAGKACLGTGIINSIGLRTTSPSATALTGTLTAQNMFIWGVTLD